MTPSPLVALAGQPNCGKSTLFNALTGARQHVANYPGVTVDKMSGWYRHNGIKVRVVDLPGTYSLTSYSPEERVARDFLIHQAPSVTLNVLDAANLKRSLYLTFQLIEMQLPMVLAVNMMDVAEKRKIRIDPDRLSSALGLPVVPTAMKKGKGKSELLAALHQAMEEPGPEFRVDYGPLEPVIESVTALLGEAGEGLEPYPSRWLAIKLLEGDSGAEALVKGCTGKTGLLEKISSLGQDFASGQGHTPELAVTRARYAMAQSIVNYCVTRPGQRKNRPLSDRIDAVVCHRIAGPLILVGVIWLLYYLSIVQGYKLTAYTWPLLAGLRELVSALCPDPGFLDIPLFTAFGLWLADSVISLLNYLPIFFILFSFIAVLEDSGYMPRMAFIMDRLFSRYGLHGQSTLPMVLGGIYVGGCAVPGVMSCKGIPDERSRLATILIIPLLNCLAKVPLYILLINIYFAAHKALAMFYISTISLLMVLPISRVLTLTVLREKETAPFVMEMSPYHMPALRGVLSTTLRRVWSYVKKIATIVIALAAIIFVLLQYPGLSPENRKDFDLRAEAARAQFRDAVAGTAYARLGSEEGLMAAVLYWKDFREQRMKAGGAGRMDALKARFKARNPRLYTLVQPGRDPAAKQVQSAFRDLVQTRDQLLREMRRQRIDQSFLGRFGRMLEPVTQWAGFNWRVNVALLSAFAAKESTVATLGALYDQDENGEGTGDLETRMARTETGFTPLHALALMMFMVLYPPCLATAVAVKLQSGETRWMIFAMVYPMALGLGVSCLIFTGGTLLGFSGIQAMGAFYLLALAVTVFTGFLPDHRP